MGRIGRMGWRRWGMGLVVFFLIAVSGQWSAVSEGDGQYGRYGLNGQGEEGEDISHARNSRGMGESLEEMGAIMEQSAVSGQLSAVSEGDGQGGEGLGENFWEALGVVCAVLWGLVQGTRFWRLRVGAREKKILEFVAGAVTWVYHTQVRHVKGMAPGRKITNREALGFRREARVKARALAREAGMNPRHLGGDEVLNARIEKAVNDAKG